MAIKGAKVLSAAEIEELIAKFDKATINSLNLVSVVALAPRIAATLRAFLMRERGHQSQIDACIRTAQGKRPVPQPSDPTWSDAIAFIVKLRGQIARVRSLAIEHGCDPKLLELDMIGEGGPPRG